MGDHKGKILTVAIFSIFIMIGMASSVRLPVIGGDDATWGEVLNSFLNTSLGVNGTVLNVTAIYPVNGSNITDVDADQIDGFDSSHFLPENDTMNKLMLSQDIIPVSSSLYDLGNTTNPYEEIHLRKDANSKIFFGSTTASMNNEPFLGLDIVTIDSGTVTKARPALRHDIVVAASSGSVYRLLSNGGTVNKLSFNGGTNGGMTSTVGTGGVTITANTQTGSIYSFGDSSGRLRWLWLFNETRIDTGATPTHPLTILATEVILDGTNGIITNKDNTTFDEYGNFTKNITVGSLKTSGCVTFRDQDGAGWSFLQMLNGALVNGTGKCGGT